MPQSESVTMDELVTFITQQLLSQHKHDWAVIGVDYPKEPHGHPRLEGPADVTYAALKCSCGDLKTVTLNGRWGMSQLVITIGEKIAEQYAAE